MPEFDDISKQGSWYVTSAQMDHGVGNIIDGNINTFWQSKSVAPHTVEVNFSSKQIISSIELYICYAADTTYSPLLVSILYGQDGINYQEFQTFTINEMNGWYTINTVKDNRPLTAFSLQFIIHETHHSGQNVRLRQIKILTPHIIPSIKQALPTYSDSVLTQLYSCRFSVY